MTFTVGFIYFYIIGALACMMYVLREMRRMNEEEKRGHEDWAIAAATILICAFWLPILLFIVVAVTAVCLYDWISGYWA
jgi:H+/gluconate symporter-like permease